MWLTLKDEGTWKEEVYVKMKEVAANRSQIVTKEVSEDWDNQYITVLRHLVTAATKNEDSIEESIRDGFDQWRC